MGGLVVKQALVLASNRSDCEDIRSSTAGVVFLGTPHEGTTIAQWASFLAMIKGNDSKLLEQLQPKAEMLYDLSHDFASGYQHLKTVCFYEKVRNTYVGGTLDLTIVDQRSAVQVGKAMEYLITDHSGLNKFSGVDDSNFKLVRDAVVGMFKDSKREGINQAWHELLCCNLTLVSALICDSSPTQQEFPLCGLQATKSALHRAEGRTRQATQGSVSLDPKG